MICCSGPPIRQKNTLKKTFFSGGPLILRSGWTSCTKEYWIPPPQTKTRNVFSKTKTQLNLKRKRYEISQFPLSVLHCFIRYLLFFIYFLVSGRNCSNKKHIWKEKMISCSHQMEKNIKTKCFQENGKGGQYFWWRGKKQQNQMKPYIWRTFLYRSVPNCSELFHYYAFQISLLQTQKSHVMRVSPGIYNSSLQGLVGPFNVKRTSSDSNVGSTSTVRFPLPVFFIKMWIQVMFHGFKIAFANVFRFRMFRICKWHCVSILSRRRSMLGVINTRNVESRQTILTSRGGCSPLLCVGCQWPLGSSLFSTFDSSPTFVMDRAMRIIRVGAPISIHSPGGRPSRVAKGVTQRAGC